MKPKENKISTRIHEIQGLFYNCDEDDIQYVGKLTILYLPDL